MKKWTIIGILLATLAGFGAYSAGLYDSHVTNTVKIGDGLDSDKILEFKKGASNNPYLGYDTTSGSLVFSSDGVTEGTIGSGGTLPTYVSVSGTTPSIASFESGKHYLVDMTAASGDTTVTLMEGEDESVIRASLYNNPSDYKLIIDGFGAEKILYNDIEYDDVSMGMIVAWARFDWDTTNGYWIVNDPSVYFNGTFNGNLLVTGSSEFQNGISGDLEGATDASTPSSGYVGEQLTAGPGTTPSMSLPAGNWLTWCNCLIVWGSGGQPLDPNCGVSLTGVSTFDDYKYFRLQNGVQSAGGFKIQSPNVVYNLSSSATLYCAISADGGGTYSLNGTLTAIRLP